jgi:hypothetical protein
MMENNIFSRREFIKKVALILLLASPIGRWIWQRYQASRVPRFDSFALPLIRRVFPQLTAEQLVSVQPMTSPTALIFYMDYSYNDKHIRRRV